AGMPQAERPSVCRARLLARDLNPIEWTPTVTRRVSHSLPVNGSQTRVQAAVVVEPQVASPCPLPRCNDARERGAFDPLRSLRCTVPNRLLDTPHSMIRAVRSPVGPGAVTPAV